MLLTSYLRAPLDRKSSAGGGGTILSGPGGGGGGGTGKHGCQMAIAKFLGRMCWPFGLLDYGSATLQNLIPSSPWIVPPRPPPWRNPRNGRHQILPCGNLGEGTGKEGRGLTKRERRMMRATDDGRFLPRSHD